MTNNIPIINHRAELQVSKWEESEKLRENVNKRDAKHNLGPFLALSR